MLELNAINDLRKKTGLSQKEFAGLFNVHQTAVSQWETGKTTTDKETLIKIADYFGVSIDYLLGNTEQKEKASIPKDEREITLDDFTFAMQNETKDLTDMDKQILLSMARQLNDMRRCLINEIGVPYINFKTIGDYIILMCYYLKLLYMPKTEIKTFIREFEKITNDYSASVNPSVSSIVIHPDLSARMTVLKDFI